MASGDSSVPATGGTVTISSSELDFDYDRKKLVLLAALDRACEGQAYNGQDFSIDTNKQLGRGSFGEVHLATNLRTGTQVAVKSINKCVLNLRCLEYLVREIEVNKVLAHPEHPNIVRFIACFNEAATAPVRLVFEYCRHGELYEFVQSLPDEVLDVRRMATYMFQAADALRHAHSLGVMHRDLKPENMLLGEFKELKVADFGCAVHDPSKGKRKSHCGTLVYMAPEMIEFAEYDEKVDEWSLGVMCYELLNGVVPFEGDEEESVSEKILAFKYERPQGMNEQAMDLVSKLFVTASQRISMSDILSHPFVTENLETTYFDPKDPRLESLMERTRQTGA